MEIRVFGSGCSKCEEAALNVGKAVRECGSDAEVIKVKDFKEMMSFGVMSTPAVAFGRSVKCTGRVPSVAEVKEWLSE